MAGECPDPRNLIQLGTSAVGEGTFGQYDEHLESCTACQAILQQFLKNGMNSVNPPLFDCMSNGELPIIPGFEIDRELGRGATGVVYLARQDGIGRRVALKLVPGGHAAGERERRRWLREAAAAARVRHPHVVTLHDFGEAPPWSYLVLEFIPGGTLKSRVGDPLPPRDAARLIEIVARAVHQIHQDGCYHLDLKPSNILLEGDETTPLSEVIPKVSDFSIARLAGDVTASISAGMPIGTPAYMSPEQTGKANAPIGAASDVYSLGAILYDLLTGRPPIQRVSIVETLDAICAQEPISPRRLNPAISRDLETICLKCLEKQAFKRYVSTETLAEDLCLYLQGRPIVARPVWHVEHVWRWCLRNPAVAGLSAGLALLAGCGLMVLLLLLKDARAGRLEARRGRSDAENNYRVASDGLSDALSLSGLITQGLSEQTDDSVIDVLSRLRNRQTQFLRARPEVPEVANQLLQVNTVLAGRLTYRRNFGAAREIISQSLGILAQLSAIPQSHEDVRFRAIWCHWVLSSIHSAENRIEQAISEIKIACQLLEGIDTKLATGNDLRLAVNCHLQVFELLSRNIGTRDQAKEWLKDHERWFNSSEFQKLSQPYDLRLRSLWLVRSEKSREALALLRYAVALYPKDVELARMFAEQLKIAADGALPRDEALAHLGSRFQSHPQDVGLARALAYELIATAKSGPPPGGTLAYLRTAVRAHPKDVDLARVLAEQLIAAAEFLHPDEKRRALLNEAKIVLSSIADVAELVASSDPGDVTALLAFGHVYQQLCHCLVELGCREEAIKAFRRMISAQRFFHPKQASEPSATDAYWREIAKTILVIRAISISHLNSSPDSFVRIHMSDMGFQPQSEGHFGWLLICAEGDLAARMRRVEQRDNAKQQVAQMTKYASGLVAKCSTDPLAHLALSEALIHVYKNAVRYKDTQPETALRQALDSAERALAISPGNSRSQEAVANCRRRLKKITPAS